MNDQQNTSRAPGGEVDINNVFVPDRFEVFAAMASDPRTMMPATPTIYLELSGFMADELPLPEGHDRAPSTHVRVLLEVAGAEGIAAGILNSLGQLRRLAKNQERR